LSSVVFVATVPPILLFELEEAAAEELEIFLLLLL